VRITVLGAGSWGTTLAILLNYNGHDVTLWSFRDEDARTMRECRENTAFLPGFTIPDDIAITSTLQEGIRDAEMIVTAVPTQFLRSTISPLRQQALGDVIVVNVAKGIENNTLMSVSEILQDTLPSLKRDYAFGTELCRRGEPADSYGGRCCFDQSRGCETSPADIHDAILPGVHER
jgi:glycerol-3-phosphate dehydrogenase (NAD(P)+)